MDEDFVREMTTTSLVIKTFDNPTQAPSYGENVLMLRIEEALIVGNGTEAGKPTVDLKMIDADGNPFLVMATGAILDTLAAAIRGVEARGGE